VYDISPNLCLKLSYCAAKNASFTCAEAKWARKKADAVVGSLGHSKMEGESNGRPFSFFTFCKQQSGVQIQEKDFICCTSVCCFLLLGHSSLAPLGWMIVHPT